MGTLIVLAQMTKNSVMDQVERWFVPASASEEHGLEELLSASALLLGRGSFAFLSSSWPTQSGVYADLVNPL